MPEMCVASCMCLSKEGPRENAKFALEEALQGPIGKNFSI